MTSSHRDPTATPAPTARVGARPLERAQVVWRRAVTLADPANDSDRFLVVLDLLRTAGHGPSTMLHALALGRTQLRARPGDIPAQDAVRLLTHAVGWLGKRTDEDEIGTRLGNADAHGNAV